ncbi:cytochrome c oxidase cbb3-type subunit 4 [Sphingomonas sp. YR710]|jgi:cytochrome c oxidase cbb3-type subunit 4|uniref:cbb3-type cytochrome c oxidase subunit 3 n=1 Tax=Sphingomonas sp. YR710 TaxID=1882773 RepID=UPI0008868325|nr:cbb3-type cytochrome c oxidase subunit 3 [Sphingomonas sp. YR710]SDD23443.1 cytochrome c oxidase cbb3-type subunit 4 [Sphingomonas sp. YR710]
MMYDALRHAADTWGMIFLGLIFLLALWFALRPSARSRHEDASLIPFRDESPLDD